MKNIAPLFNRALLTVAGALALGACSRGNYAVLPKAPAYLGSAPIAATAPRPAAQPQATAPAAAAPEAAKPVAAAPKAAPAVAAAKAEAPAAKPAAAPVAATVAEPTAAEVATAKPVKLNLVQRLALNKVVRKLDKLTQKPTMSQGHENTAGTKKLDTRLRQAILFWVLGVILEIIGAFTSGIIYVAGAVLIVVGTVFFIIWLVEKFSK